MSTAERKLEQDLVKRMAGLGFDGSGARGRGGGNKYMAMQFVKSSDSESRQLSSGSAKPAPSQLGAPAKQFDGYRERGPPMQGFVRPGETDGKSFSNGDSKATWREYRQAPSASPSKGSLSQQQTFPRTPAARLILSPQEYERRWRQEMDQSLKKIRKLAWEVANLKTDRPNAIDKLHSASNRVPTRVEFNTEPVLAGRGSNSFMCHVFVEGIAIGSGQGLKIKDAKVNAYEIALQRILMPELRVNRLDFESRELEGSKEPFTSPPPEPSKTILPKSSAQLPPSFKGDGKRVEMDGKHRVPQHKESNLEAASVRRRIEEQRPLEEFVIVEPLVPILDCTPAHTLRRSADFNHMLLEYEYFFNGEAARCVVWVEGRMLADVNAGSKLAAKNRAAEEGLQKLKEICWVIKTKQAVDSDTKISKEEMLNELTDQSDTIGDNNVGNKMLRKMGWSGGGVGKDGSGIAEPVSLKTVLNREGLGLGAEKGITDDYRKRVKEVIENYAASGNQEDLVFNCDFRLEERLIIHDECRRLNLRSKCKGKGAARYLCVRRKRSANMLFDHIMSCGGETIRYKLVPPGEDSGESYLPRRFGNGSSSTSLGGSGQGGKGHPPMFPGASKVSCNNSSSDRLKTEFKPGHIKEEGKWEFGPLPPSLMSSSVKRDYSNELLGQNSVSNHYQRQSDQNGYQNSLSESSHSMNSGSGEIKKVLIPDHDHDGGREVKPEFEAAHPSRINHAFSDGRCKDVKFSQNRFHPANKQDIRNRIGKNECESTDCRTNSSVFPVDHPNTFCNTGHSFDVRNRPPGPFQNSGGNVMMNSNCNGQSSNDFYPKGQAMEMQQNQLGPPPGIECNNFNGTTMAANFHNGGPQRAMIWQEAGLNQSINPGNNRSFSNQSKMPRNALWKGGSFPDQQPASAMQGWSNNMNPSAAGGGKWMGNGNGGPNLQQQQFLHNAAQAWGQMAAQWVAAQQGANMNAGWGGGPRFCGNGKDFNDCRGFGKGSNR